MKQYLILRPEAKDPHTARDKIYVWEMEMDKL